MSRKRHRDTPEWAWEQALIDDYHDYRWREALAPLVRAVHRWEEGKGDSDRAWYSVDAYSDHAAPGANIGSATGQRRRCPIVGDADGDGGAHATGCRVERVERP